MIKAVNVTKGFKVICRQAPQLIEEVDKLLSIFYVKQLKGDSLSEAFICERALDIYGDLVKIIIIIIIIMVIFKCYFSGELIALS